MSRVTNTQAVNIVERYAGSISVGSIRSRSIHIFNDNAMCHFRNTLKRRQKQITLDNFLVRQKASGSEAESSGAKRQRPVGLKQSQVVPRDRGQWI